MHFVLTIFIFTLVQGHSLADATYRDRIEVESFSTQADCLKALPRIRFESFARPEDLSYDIHEARCVKVVDTGNKP